ITALAASIRASKDTTVFAATYNGIFRSTDGGASWAHADSGLTRQYVWALAASADGDSTLVASTYQGDVFLSVDNGSTWHPAGFANDATGQVAICGRNIFAQSDSLGICRSTDGGKSWTPISSAFMQSTRAMSHWYYVNPNGIQGRELFAGVGSATVQGVFRSTDDGLTWTMQNGYPYSSAFTISGSDYFLVDGIPCFVSTDAGTHWRHITPDIPEQVWVSGLAVSGPNVILATYGTIYRQDLTQIITSTESPTRAKPTPFRLKQNYPNPFNPTTVIRGEWTENSEVRLVVYDVLGREVAVLANGRYPAGAHSFAFDGTNLASGVYFYRLTAGGHSAVRRMVLLR
ncbi:MAG: T9SS type A sorting domain-containing protein, partial [Bacteroidota bacterium]